MINFNVTPKFKAENVYVVPNTSGKVGISELQKWFRNIAVPNVGQNSLILWDALTTHNKKNFKNVDFQGKEIDFVSIPGGMTRFVQPLGINRCVWNVLERLIFRRIWIQAIEIIRPQSLRSIAH